jgi:hypothetical protein
VILVDPTGDMDAVGLLGAVTVTRERENNGNVLVGDRVTVETFPTEMGGNNNWESNRWIASSANVSLRQCFVKT